MFHTLSNMLPSIFRVSRTLDLQDLSRKWERSWEKQSHGYTCMHHTQPTLINEYQGSRKLGGWGLEPRPPPVCRSKTHKKTRKVRKQFRFIQIYPWAPTHPILIYFRLPWKPRIWKQYWLRAFENFSTASYMATAHAMLI